MLKPIVANFVAKTVDNRDLNGRFRSSPAFIGSIVMPEDKVNGLKEIRKYFNETHDKVVYRPRLSKDNPLRKGYLKQRHGLRHYLVPDADFIDVYVW